MAAGPRTASSLASPWPWVVACAGAALLFLHHGYTFQLNDQLQYLLLPYRSIYPDFAKGDWFTWQTAHYHMSFAWLVRALHATVGEPHFADALLVVHLLCLAWLCMGIERLSRASGAGTAGALVGLLVILWVRGEGIAGATFNHAQLVPADLAMPPLLLACAAWLQARYRPAGVWLGLSGLLHANFAVLGPLLLGAAEVGLLLGARPQPMRPQQRAERLHAVVACAALSAPSLWLIAAGFFTGDKHPEAVDIVFRIRSPHHYDLGSLPAVDFWWPALLVGWALPALLVHARRPWGRIQLLHAATVLWLAVGLLGTAASVGPLVRLFLWRLSPLWFLLLLDACVCALRQAHTRGGVARLAGWLWLASGGLAMAAFGRSDMALVAPLGLPPAWFGLPAVATALVASAGLITRKAAVGGLALCMGVAVATHSLAAPPQQHVRAGALRKPVFGGPRVGRFVRDETHKHVKQQQLTRWVRAHTRPGERFLIPPSFISFRIRTHRAVFVDFKAAPMRGEEALEWRRRMLAAMGTDDFPTTGYPLRHRAGELYDQRPLPELAALARREGLDYVVTTRKPGAEQAGLSQLMRDGDYALYRVR